MLRKTNEISTIGVVAARNQHKMKITNNIQMATMKCPYWDVLRIRHSDAPQVTARMDSDAATLPKKRLGTKNI